MDNESGALRSTSDRAVVNGAVSVSAVPASVPSAVLDAVASAIERARCPGREGPYGGYDYGHDTAFYGPEPKDGRYVVRDFRDPRLPTWGKWVHQTHDHDEHEQAFKRLTGRHIAEAAITAYAQGMKTRQGGDAQQAPSRSDDSPVRKDAPTPNPEPNHE